MLVAKQPQQAKLRDNSSYLHLLTTFISLPLAFLKALVHLTLRGLRFFRKALWHFGLQKRNVCTPKHNQMFTN